MARPLRVLLTGRSGFLGQAVAADLARDHTIVCVSRVLRTANDDVEHIQADLSQPLQPGRLPHQIDVVVHLAQSLLYRDAMAGAADLFAVNVAATGSLLRWAVDAGAHSFIFASTGNVYGQGPEMGDEAGPVDVRGDLYAASKLAGEALVFGYARALAAAALRIFALYGPGQKGRMVSNIIDCVASGRPVIIQGHGGGMVTQPTYVDDAVAAIRTVITRRWAGAVNLAGPDRSDVRTIAEIAGISLSRRAMFEHRPEAPPCYRLPTTHRLRMLMPEHRFVGIEDGIARTTSALSREAKLEPQ